MTNIIVKKLFLLSLLLPINLIPASAMDDEAEDPLKASSLTKSWTLSSSWNFSLREEDESVLPGGVSNPKQDSHQEHIEDPNAVYQLALRKISESRVDSASDLLLSLLYARNSWGDFSASSQLRGHAFSSLLKLNERTENPDRIIQYSYFLLKAVQGDTTFLTLRQQGIAMCSIAYAYARKKDSQQAAASLKALYKFLVAHGQVFTIEEEVRVLQDINYHEDQVTGYMKDSPENLDLFELINESSAF